LRELLFDTPGSLASSETSLDQAHNTLAKALAKILWRAGQEQLAILLLSEPLTDEPVRQRPTTPPAPHTALLLLSYTPICTTERFHTLVCL
jgi:hypothetical protein